MADTKISAAADPVTLVATDKVPIARSGSTVSYAATMAEVAAFAGSTAAGVTTFNTRSGAVTLNSADVTSAGGALLASPTFTGTPNLPTGTVAVTQTAGNNTTAIATTAFVTTALTPYAPLAAPVFTGDARAVTATYGDNDTSIATTAFVQSAVTPLYDNVGRNLLHNPLFSVAQRGVGPWTSGYGLDRWSLATSTDTSSMIQGTISDTQRSQIGDEAATFALQNTFTGTSGAAALTVIGQQIENVRRLAGKTVTISFWAVASATLKLGASLDQCFGFTGSPSPTLSINGQSVTVTGTYARYSITLTLPSIIGKTVGTDSRDATILYFWYSSGSTNNVRSGNVGVQSGTINIWGVQLEIGTVATPLEKPDPQQDLAKCQRFYQSFAQVMVNGYNTAGGNVYQTLPLPVQMRATPTTIAFPSPSYGNASALGVNTPNRDALVLTVVITTAGGGYGYGPMTVSADL